MSKFCSQQLPVCKVIPPSGYSSRKVGGVSSGLMGWLTLCLAAILGWAITLPVHADEDCKSENTRFREWCQQFAGPNSSYGPTSCSDSCVILFVSKKDTYDSFKEGCESFGGKLDYDKWSMDWSYTCSWVGNPTQNQKQPPQANFTFSPSEGPTPLTVTLDGKGSTDDGSIASYQWATSDGKTASGSTASFVFDKEGAYTITLTVTDNDGLTNNSSQTVTVTSSSLKADFTFSPATGEPPLTVTLDAGVSTPQDGSIVSYEWQAESLSSGKIISLPSNKNSGVNLINAGKYQITLTVTDKEGNKNSVSKTITVGNEGEIQVKSVTSKYPEGTHFLDGVDHDVTYTAEIDWGETEPGTVSFVTPTGTKDVATTGNTAEQTFNMGKDFGVCGKLKVVATSKDGTKSPEKEADFVTMSKPRENLIFVRIGEDTGGFSYSLSLGGVNIDFFDLLAESAGEDPMLHETPLRLKLIPTVAITVDSSKGETKMEMDWENFNLSGEKEFKVGSFEAELHPTINVNGKFESCEWKWGGDVGISGSSSFKASTLIGAFSIGWVPVPIYCKFTISAGTNGKLSVEKVEPFVAMGKIDVSLGARGSVGAGYDEVVAIEGWVELGGKLEWKLPPLNLSNPTKGTVTDKIGVAAVALAWKWKGEIINCEWEYVTQNGKGNCSSPFIRSRYATNPTLIERDYLTNPNYGMFRKSMRELRDSQPVSLQQAVYPYSDADTSGSQNALYATWLSDNSARSAVNRTQVVFSTWNGTDWTNPQPIADDGTADFHPKILAFGDNSALATWEDVKTTLADTAQLEDMLQAMEISVSSYNPQTQQWTGTQRLTDNTSLDRSPKLAGKTTGNAIVTWISNVANDIMGSADKPNQLWYARYANNSWNTPQQVANIPYPLLKYNTAFDGQNGYVVLSVDTDGDLTTIEDHELFQLTFTNGVWSALTRLTTDTLADDNPQLGLDPNGQVVLTWLKNNEISSVVNFDLNTRTVVRTDDSGYSSNLADFKLAQATEGKLAIVWAEPSAEHSSDLHALFYNPVGNIWGGLRQLTADSETEKRITATFFGTDTLVALYNRSQVGDVSTSTSPTTSPKVDTPVAVYTDLYMLKHTLRAIDFTKIDLPELGAIEGDTFAFDPAGNLTDTQAILSGGISINGGPFKNLITFQDNLEHGENAEPVTLKGLIIPDPKHDGKSADIFAFGEYTPYGDDLNDTTCPTQVANPEAVPFYVMESLPKNYVTWEGAKTPSSIPAFLYKNVMLKSGEAQEFILFEGPFDARGCLSISFGYLLQESGAVVYNHHTATVDNSIGVTVRKK